MCRKFKKPSWALEIYFFGPFCLIIVADYDTFYDMENFIGHKF